MDFADEPDESAPSGHSGTDDPTMRWEDVGYPTSKYLSSKVFHHSRAGCAYWNGEAMHCIDHNDLDETPDAVATTSTSAHLAGLVGRHQYPATS